MLYYSILYFIISYYILLYYILLYYICNFALFCLRTWLMLSAVYRMRASVDLTDALNNVQREKETV